MNDDPELSLVRSVGDENGLQILAGLGEFTLDQFLEDGMLRDAPMVGTLFGLLKTGRNVRDFLYAKKIAKFLVNVREIDSDERKRFTESAEKDPKQQRRIGATVLLLIERHTDMAKSALLGRLFSQYVAGAMSFGQFGRLADALDRLMIDDLRVLVAGAKTENKFGSISPAVSRLVAPEDVEGADAVVDLDTVYQSLYSAGLLRLDVVPTIRDVDMGNTYSLSRLGKFMADALDEIDWGDV